jgi:hypothetical protein
MGPACLPSICRASSTVAIASWIERVVPAGPALDSRVSSIFTAGPSPPTHDPRKVAVGYTLLDTPATGLRERTEPPHGAQASGGGYSTVRDLIQFVLALHDGRLMSPESVEILMTGKESVESSGPGVVAYGFLDRRVNGVRIVENSGGAPESTLPCACIQRPVPCAIIPPIAAESWRVHVLCPRH